MNSDPIIKKVKLALKTVSKEIFDLIGDVRPDWNSSNTRFQTFTEGITNSIFALFDTRNESDESQGLVIKVFGAQTEKFIDRQSELDAMIKLSKAGVLSQRLLIQFDNGLIYEYAPGSACSREDVRKEKIGQLIAMKLAQVHSVSIQSSEKAYIIILLRKFLLLINEDEEQRKKIATLASDVDLIEKHILGELVPNAQVGRDLVLCHNDLLVKNIIYDEKTEQVSFIDFEYTRLNYYLFDIANHFVEYAGVDDADFSLYPTREEQKRWLETYFRTRPIKGQVVNDELCHLIDRFSALSHLMWGLWALVQSRLSQLDFDYVDYAQLRLDSYQRLRSILFENLSQ